MCCMIIGSNDMSTAAQEPSPRMQIFEEGNTVAIMHSASVEFAEWANQFPQSHLEWLPRGVVPDSLSKTLLAFSMQLIRS